MFKVGICGFILIGIGQIVSAIGRFGWAGSGVLDVFDKADLSDKTSSAEKPEPIVMVRCRECGKLNEEDSKFCRECGKSLL